jgi:Na+-transporting NADH:ubiquinone oxidoreductase subunit C
VSNEVDRAPGGWIGLRHLPHDSDLRAVIVSLIVCLVCSAAISLTVSLLHPYKEANRARERRARIEQIVASTPGLAELVEDDAGAQLEVRIVDLETGERVEGVDPEDFDPVAAARDPELGVAIPPEADVAGLGRRARHGLVYLVRSQAGPGLIVLPVEGTGYVSTMRGYLALEPDLRTIRALSFYEQSETPGLGGEIENPEWLDQWAGKRAFDADGRVRIAVATPGDESTAADRIHRVDGISGATRTGAGVTRMLRFWLGPWGYGPTLSRLADETAAPEAGEGRG